jgi:hypothetical protein
MYLLDSECEAGQVPRVKWQGHEADQSLGCSAEVNNDGAIPPLTHTYSWTAAEVIKYRDNFTFTFYRIAVHFNSLLYKCASHHLVKAVVEPGQS